MKPPIIWGVSVQALGYKNEGDLQTQIEYSLQGWYAGARFWGLERCMTKFGILQHKPQALAAPTVVNFQEICTSLSGTFC